MQAKQNKGSYRRVSKELSNASGVERHLRLAEAAAVTGLSRSTLWRLCQDGAIRHVRIAARGLERTLILLPESSLRAFLRAQECGGDATL